MQTAEPVQHILQVCSQKVLCRTGYRGLAFIKEVVTTRFDSPFFLPPEGSGKDRCESIIERVPSRLWPKFTAVAAAERPRSLFPEHGERIHLVFFSSLLEKAYESVAQGKSQLA